MCGIEALQTGEELHFRNLDLTFHVGYLASITEKFSGQLTVTVLDGETVLASEKINITVMAFDEFRISVYAGASDIFCNAESSGGGQSDPAGIEISGEMDGRSFFGRLSVR